MSEQDTLMTPERGAAADRHARHQAEAALAAVQAEVAALRQALRQKVDEWRRRATTEHEFGRKKAAANFVALADKYFAHAENLNQFSSELADLLAVASPETP